MQTSSINIVRNWDDIKDLRNALRKPERGRGGLPYSLCQGNRLAELAPILEEWTNTFPPHRLGSNSRDGAGNRAKRCPGDRGVVRVEIRAW